MQSAEAGIYRTVFHSVKSGEANGTFSVFQIPEVNHFVFKTHVGPGIPQTPVMVMIGGINAG